MRTIGSLLAHRALPCLPSLVTASYLDQHRSEGHDLVHASGSEAGALVRIEHDEVDLALNVLHQLHQPAGQHQQSLIKPKCLSKRVQFCVKSLELDAV